MTMELTIRTVERAAEIAWFGDLCGGDTEYLGVLDPDRRSSFAHCSDIVLAAERLGYRNILLPNSYVVGQDPLTFASGIAPHTRAIQLLVAQRCGELHPPMLARSLACLDHMLQGRLTVNIINSELPGLRESPELRYQRCAEVIEILRQGWTQERIVHRGEIYQFDLPADPVKPYQQNGGPLLYFGGISDGAREVCARYCDVFLMWPETEANLAETMRDMSARAARHGRTIDFGLRIHVIVRETEAEARAFARRLLSRLDLARGQELKHRTQDSRSAGVLRQDELRAHADDEGFIEPLVWSGIGLARSGCGSALVGDPDQIAAKIERYLDMGFRSFIFSGYPLIEEAELFARHVLPRLPRISLPQVQGRIPETPPVTPLTTAPPR